LEEGPAFGSDARQSVGAALDRPPSGDGSYADRVIERIADWPTYRSDVRRSGYQDLAAPGEPKFAWTTKLSSPITAPVSADGLVLVAETDRHTLHALSAADGKSVWTFVADGRIDSPPTLSAGRCLFGTRSGFVYCLRASDGALIWRFHAAPQDRRIFAYEQLQAHGTSIIDGQGSLVGSSFSPTLAFGGYPIMARKVDQALWDQWRQRIRRQRASKLSVAAFCREESVSQATFYTWKRKLQGRRAARQTSTKVRATRPKRRKRAAAARGQAARNSAARSSLPTRAVDFLQLPVRGVRTSPWIEMTLVDGTLVRIPQDNLAALSALLKLLRGDDPEVRASEVQHA